jgi:dihydrofolate synthase/folylpolyglutamate synthase
MNYTEAVAHLYALGPELSASKFVAGAAARPALRKFDLAHMRTLCAALGHPERRVPAVLIAGTNGKGSTAATLASILHAAGYRTGLYTSPHLIRINERIQLSRGGVLTPIEDEEFARVYGLVDEAATRLMAAGELPLSPSFFERVTAVAYLDFARVAAPADVMVLEVGMGGRLDATNVVEPLVSVITDIALDHQEYLGETIAEIAREKAGILREHGTLITLPQHPEANRAIGEVATALDARGINAAMYLPPAVRNGEPVSEGRGSHSSRYSRDEWGTQDFSPVELPRNRYELNLEPGLLTVDSPLAGQHQQRNLALAIAAAVELRNQHGYKITNASLEQGIRETVWPGRLEKIAPDLLLDVAHNPAGAWTLRAAIASLPETQPRTLIFSCLRDKSLAEMSRILFPLFDSSGDGDPLRSHDHLILAPISSPRAAEVEDLVAAAEALGVPAIVARDMSEALEVARSVTPRGGLILATGSVYLVGEVRQLVLDAAVVGA